MSNVIIANPEFCKDCNLPKYCCLGDICVLSQELSRHKECNGDIETLEQIESKFMIEAEKLIVIYRNRYPEEIDNWAELIVKDLLNLITIGMDNATKNLDNNVTK